MLRRMTALKIMNRELSWLSFNHRVLQEAENENNPLVDRFKFLGIFSNNFDEFFKVRVATIKRMIELEAGSKRLGMDPQILLSKVQDKVMTMQNRQQEVFDGILAGLRKQNIFLVNETQLNEEQSAFVKRYFMEFVLPVFSPIMLKNVEVFPNLEDKAIYLATKLSRQNGEYEYALIELPTSDLPRFIVLPSVGEQKYIIMLDDILRHNLPQAFSFLHFDKFEAFTIKFTRDAELDIDNDVTKSFLEKISKGIKGRSKGQPVRFVFDRALPTDLLGYLKRHLRLDQEDDLIPGARYHNFKDFMSFPNVGGPGLESSPWPPLLHPGFHMGESILDRIQKQDLMLHVPYQNFSHYIFMLHEAAIDPAVIEIKITLYRVARTSKVVNALMNALKNGKKVTVVIELQARFDEQANINWSRRLEEAGARVLFGIPGLKVHSKLTLVTRKAPGRLIHYACVSTGNFHEGNAAVYTDVLLMTADPRITREVVKVFDHIETPYKVPAYRHLLVSPHYMRKRFITLIREEMISARQGKEAWIMIKINNLVDADMIKLLYKASQAGVKIRLLVRGICSLLPGVHGLSENIEAVSVVGRFLEHSRLFIFCNKGDERYYLSSADWMTRNLDSRIEVACPIYDRALQKELKMIVETGLNDNVQARIINELQDNPYKPRKPDEQPVHSQKELYEYYGSQGYAEWVSDRENEVL